MVIVTLLESAMVWMICRQSLYRRGGCFCGSAVRGGPILGGCSSCEAGSGWCVGASSVAEEGTLGPPGGSG